jgi:hypothetical protein
MATASSSESDGSVGESIEKIRVSMDALAHATRHLYAGAVRVAAAVENPGLTIWTQPYKVHERARLWAKRHMVASTSSLWQIQETLLEAAKKSHRIHADGTVTLTHQEAEILELVANTPVKIWDVLGRLPRFFI